MTAQRRLPSDFGRSAAYPLFALDPHQDRTWFLHFEADDYRRASFLDRRALLHRPISGWELTRFELEALLADSASLPVHWLFHIGHCGSTLVSRLLDLLPGVLGLREPLPLLTLAAGRDDATRAWQDTVVRLLARGFDDTRAVIVKPTSLVATLAPSLLADTSRGCLLWVDLQTWLATMLRERELIDPVFAHEHLRLAGTGLEDTQPNGPPLADGPRLARAWLAEQLRWHGLMTEPHLGPRLTELDFAELLAAPAEVAARLARHYGLEVPDDWAQRVEGSGLLTRYAKDGAQRFDAQSRERELADAAARHAETIDDGLRWAEATLANLGLPALASRLRPRAR